jgi:hypothetical protein
MGHPGTVPRSTVGAWSKANTALILRMNALLNDLMAREVGANDGQFLPAPVRPKGSVCCD